MLIRLLTGLAAAALAAGAQAQQKHEVKVATFVPAPHFMSQWLVKWGEKLEKDSSARLVFKHFPNSQMAPTPQMDDLARTGQAEVFWFLHGATPRRFQLTELVQLPYVVGSAESGTKMMNEPELRSTSCSSLC